MEHSRQKLNDRFLKMYTKDFGNILYLFNTAAQLKSNARSDLSQQDGADKSTEKSHKVIEKARETTGIDFFRHKHAIVCGHIVPSNIVEEGAQDKVTEKQQKHTNHHSSSDLTRIAEEFLRKNIPNPSVAAAFGLLFNQAYLQSLSVLPITEHMFDNGIHYALTCVDDGVAESLVESKEEEGLYTYNIKQDFVLRNTMDCGYSNPNHTISADLTFEFRDQGNGEVRLDLVQKKLSLYVDKSNKLTSEEKSDIKKIKKVLKYEGVALKNIKDLIPAVERLEKDSKQSQAKSQKTGTFYRLISFFINLFKRDVKDFAYAIGANQENSPTRNNKSVIFLEYDEQTKPKLTKTMQDLTTSRKAQTRDDTIKVDVNSTKHEEYVRSLGRSTEAVLPSKDDADLNNNYPNTEPPKKITYLHR